MSEPTSLRVDSAETVALSTTTAPSSAIGTAITNPSGNQADSDTRIVRVVSTADVWLEFGSAPVAVAESAGAVYLPAGLVEYFRILAGYKIAGILASGTGSLNIAVMR